MNKANVIFGRTSSRTSFLRGVSKIFDIGATTKRVSLGNEQSDAEALRRDWETIGDNMWGAIDEYKKDERTRRK